MSQVGCIVEQDTKCPTRPVNALKSVDIRTVDPNTLVDIRDVVINQDLCVEERLIDFVRQIKNPYCYKFGKALIKVEHEDTEASLEDRLESYFMSL
ncbi:MAG: hypothetical protein FWE21_08245 [Defluviitaleaceae bacterium]|nr:hypothetical protein [Defluviitaleaceae bacterium]